MEFAHPRICQSERLKKSQRFTLSARPRFQYYAERFGSTTSDSSGEQNPVTIRRVVNRMESRRIVSQDAVELTNEELVVHDKNGRWEPQGNSDRKESPVEFDSVCERQPQATEEETVRIRAARAKFIEETTYHLTDLFTIISARLEMLSEKVPEGFRPELLGIRGVLARGVELNHRLYLTAQACRQEIGRPLTTTEIIEEQEA